MPYVINLKSDKAGTKEVNTETLAEEDYEITPEDLAELAKFDPVKMVIEGLEAYQKKMAETDPATKQKIATFIAKKQAERSAMQNKDSSIGTVQIGVDEDDDEVEEHKGGIPF